MKDHKTESQNQNLRTGQAKIIKNRISQFLIPI